MNELLELVAKSLVDQPEEVSVERFEEDDAIVFELRVAPEDLGKVIGRQGRTIKALRSLLGVAGMKMGQRLILEVPEP